MLKESAAIPRSEAVQAIAMVAVVVTATAPTVADVGGVSPSLPGGVTDVTGALGYVAEPDGSIAAIDLATGKSRWTTRQGRWPLAAQAGWLAVVAPDGAQRNTARVRFLRPADGKLIAEAAIRFPDGVSVGSEGDGADGEVVIAGHNASLSLTAEAAGGRLRVSWAAQSWIPSGFRPSPVQRIAGVATVDPAKGAVEMGPSERGAPPPPPAPSLPAGFTPVPGAMYWSFSRFGMAWSNRPTTFRIGADVVAFFSYEARPARRLLLNRLRNGVALPPIVIASGDEYAPLVSPDGGHLVLTSGTAERPVLTLYDLSRAGTNTQAARLGPLDTKFRPPFAVFGARLLFVAEADGALGAGGATIFPRRLVALDTASGRVSWAHALPSRVLPAPTPGAR